MSLLTPDSGLLFWMVIVFGIVFVILAKYGFPVITRMVDERKQYIDKSLLAAREANEQLANIKADSEMILAKAHEEQARILNEAVATRERILKEAKTQAQVEGQKLLDEAKKQIQAEKDSAISDIRRQVAVLSVDIAEKVLRKNLDDEKEQMEMSDRLLDESFQCVMLRLCWPMPTKRGQRILCMRKPEYWQIVSRESPNFDRHWIILYCLLKQS